MENRGNYCGETRARMKLLECKSFPTLFLLLISVVKVAFYAVLLLLLLASSRRWKVKVHVRKTNNKISTFPPPPECQASTALLRLLVLPGMATAMLGEQTCEKFSNIIKITFPCNFRSSLARSVSMYEFALYHYLHLFFYSCHL